MDISTKQLMSALAQSGAAGIKEVFRAQLEQALNNLLKAELAGFLGYDSYERCGFSGILDTIESYFDYVKTAEENSIYT